jgi:hypothetical protein
MNSYGPVDTTSASYAAGRAVTIRDVKTGKADTIERFAAGQLSERQAEILERIHTEKWTP